MNPGTLDRKILILRQLEEFFLVDPEGNFLTDSTGNKLTTGSRKDAFGQELSTLPKWSDFKNVQKLFESGQLFLADPDGNFLVDSEGNRLSLNSDSRSLEEELSAFTWKKRMAKRIEKPGKSETENARERISGMVTFKIRYTAGIRPSTDSLFDILEGQEYEIEDFIGNPRHSLMEIHCKRFRTPEKGINN